MSAPRATNTGSTSQSLDESGGSEPSEPGGQQKLTAEEEAIRLAAAAASNPTPLISVPGSSSSSREPQPSQLAQLRAVVAHYGGIEPTRRFQVAVSLLAGVLSVNAPHLYDAVYRRLLQPHRRRVVYDALLLSEDNLDAAPAVDDAPAIPPGSAQFLPPEQQPAKRPSAMRRRMADAARSVPEPTGSAAAAPHKEDEVESNNRNSKPFKGTPPAMPECWGHRGASGAFPENTLASFERAVADGSEGIESDVHITSDDVIVMFHDPSLERTTNGHGLIRDQNYYGNIEHITTAKAPHQKIPTFQQLCDFLMRPECMHVKINIDIKPDNDPERLFRLMKAIVSQYDRYEELLSPRIILGLWHPKFLRAALAHVPTLQRIHIGGSPALARQYFWEHCSGFSMSFAALVGGEGQAFLRDARAAGKDVFVWTVNRPDEMVEATRWGVKAVLTDNTDMFRDLRLAMEKDFAATRRTQVGRLFRWASWRYWMIPQYLIQTRWIADLERRAGEPFSEAEERALREAAARVVVPGAAVHVAQPAAAAAAAAAAAESAADSADTSTASSTAPASAATSGATTVVGSPETFKPDAANASASANAAGEAQSRAITPLPVAALSPTAAAC